MDYVICTGFMDKTMETEKPSRAFRKTFWREKEMSYLSDVIFQHQTRKPIV